MKIDLKNITESSAWMERHVWAPYYEKFHGGKALSYRGAELGISLGLGLISTAQCVGIFVESMFKGSANMILGIASTDKSTFNRGVLQITLTGSSLLLFAPAIIACQMVRSASNTSKEKSAQFLAT